MKINKGMKKSGLFRELSTGMEYSVRLRIEYWFILFVYGIQAHSCDSLSYLRRQKSEYLGRKSNLIGIIIYLKLFYFSFCVNAVPWIERLNKIKLNKKWKRCGFIVCDVRCPFITLLLLLSYFGQFVLTQLSHEM